MRRMNPENSAFAEENQIDAAVDKLMANGFAEEHISALCPKTRTRESSQREKARIYRKGLTKARMPICLLTAHWKSYIPGKVPCWERCPMPEASKGRNNLTTVLESKRV
jgi:hypothetical protein